MSVRFKKVGLPPQLAKFATANGFVHIASEDERNPDVVVIEVAGAGLPADLKVMAIDRNHRGYSFAVWRPHAVPVAKDQLGGEPALQFSPDPRLKIQAANAALATSKLRQRMLAEAKRAAGDASDDDDAPDGSPSKPPTTE